MSPSSYNNRDDGRRRNNRPKSMNGGGRHHDNSAPPRRQQHHHQQQQQRHRSNNNAAQPPPYSRYGNNHSNIESRWREPSSSSHHVAMSQQQQQQQQYTSPPTNNSNNQRTSFAEKRRLQERREFDNSFAASSSIRTQTTTTTEAATGIPFNDATTTMLPSGGSPTMLLTNPNAVSGGGGIQISNEYLKDILSTAVGAPTIAQASDTTTVDNTTSNNGTTTETNEQTRSGVVARKTSINPANYSSSGKRLGISSQQQQRFVVDNKTNDGLDNATADDGSNVFSKMAAASSSSSVLLHPPRSAASAAAAGGANSHTVVAKPSSILKPASESILRRKGSANHSARVVQQSSSSNQQRQQQQQQQQLQGPNHNNQNKVDWGDNSMMEIESRLSPVMMMTASINNNNNHNVGGSGGGGNNNYIRRNSNEPHPNNNNLPPPNHPTNFNRRGSGDAHPQSPSNNSNNNFTRRNSGGSHNSSKPVHGFNAPCRLEEHKGLHKWKDCPNNPHSDNYNQIHFKTASHQQLVESVQLERQQQLQRMQQRKQPQQQQQQQQQQRQQEANRSRGSVMHPPTVVAASSLKRPVSATAGTTASKPNPISAVAAARRSSEASNLFNTTKSARTLPTNQHSLKPHSAAAAVVGGTIPKKQTVILPHETQKLRDLKQMTEMHSSTMQQIPRKPQQQQTKKKAPQQQQQMKKVESRKLPHQSNVEYKNGRFQRRTSNNLAPSGQDAVPIAKQTSGRLVQKGNKKPSTLMRREDANINSNRVAVAPRRSNENVAAGMDTDTDESHHTLMDDEIIELDDFGNTEMMVDDNDGSGEKKETASVAAHSSNNNNDNNNNPEKDSKAASRKKKKDIGDGEKRIKTKKDVGGGEKKAKKKKDVGANEPKAKKKQDYSIDEKKAKKRQGDDGDGEKGGKKKTEDDKPIEKKKKKSKKKCRKLGCDTTRLKGSKYCKAHVAASALASTKQEKSDTSPASETDNLSAYSGKPAALQEGENGPSKKVKAKKRGRKRKAPPEPLNNGDDVLAAGKSRSNKRQALEIHRSSNNRSHSDPLMNNDDEILPELGDEEVGEMETDLFNLLDETIKIRYQDYLEEHKIDEDLLFEEEQALLASRTEDTSPSDKNSLARDASSPNGVDTGGKENMSSALLNTLTDSTSMDTGEDSEDDDQIPLFYTCEKCDRVFFDRSQVVDHENQCTNEILDGRVFTNPNDIAEYYEKYQIGGEMKHDCVIFYRPPIATPHDKSGRTISPEDFEGRGGNRNDVPQNLLDDFMSSKSPKTIAVKETKNVETDFKINPNNARHKCMVMNAIERLSSTVINPNGLPCQTITTFCGETETLYDFRVEIRPSNIPNSGLGAFLTFLGARVLRKGASDRSARLIVQHGTYDENGNLFVKTQEELTAEVFGGRQIHVTLKGDNLHHNDNSLYWSKERQRYLKAHVDKHGTLLDHFDEDEICCRVNSEVKKYRSKIPEKERIGFLGIHSESDYVEDKTLVFSSEKHGLGMLELGRYGPHRPIDVKDNLHFNFKSFIFNFEPSEWSYEVEEQRLGRDQAIDITDDATGEIHSLARQSTPIYVNEVGHNKKLHCNVDIRRNNECSVYYYVFIDKDHAMKAGDEVELLVDYRDAYEDTRERKGYGKHNNEVYGGDYDDAAARLKRNFVDREMVQLDITSLKFFDMFYLVEHLTNDVLAPIDQRIGHWQAESFARLSKDLVARQRIHWLRMQLHSRLKEMVANQDSEDKLLKRILTTGQNEMVAATEESLLKWDFTMLPEIFSFLNTVPIGDNKTLQDVMCLELSEELLYSVASKLPDPLNSTMWSKISIDLTESITRDIARYSVCYREPMQSNAEMLAKELLVCVRNAVNLVREACSIVNRENGSLSMDAGSLSMDAAIDELSFHSLSRRMKMKDVAPNGSLMNVYANDLNIRYGTAATIADIQAYQDAVELGYLEPYFDPCSTRRLTDTKLSMVSQYPSHNHNKSKQQFHHMARSIDAFKCGVARVNEQWYVLNQILLPVHILVSACVKWPAGFQFYSLEQLCGASGIKLKDAEEAIERGVMRPNWPELEDKPGSGTSTKKNKRMRGVTYSVARTLENGASEEFPGWTVAKIQRKNSHHVDSYWSHPGLDGVVVRSRVGVKEMIAKMETNVIDAKTAYNILMNEGKQKFFGGRKSSV